MAPWVSPPRHDILVVDPDNSTTSTIDIRSLGAGSGKWGFGAVLAITVLAEWFIPVDGRVDVDNWMGFGAVFGFLSCLAMVLLAKLLGWFLKRPEDYYRDDEGADEHDA